MTVLHIHCRSSHEQQRGYWLSQNNRVHSIQLLNENTFEASVNDLYRVYRVEVQLKNGVPIACTCGCTVVMQPKQVCPHVAALLYVLRDEKSLSPLLERQRQKISRQLLAMFEPPSEGYVQIQVAYRLTRYEDDTWELALRIGLDRLYVVKNIREFLRCVERKELFTFGKNYRYDPFHQNFTPVDKQIFAYLLEISAASSSFTAGKGMTIQASQMNRLLRLLSTRAFTLETHLGVHELTGLENGLPDIHFTLCQQDQGLRLTFTHPTPWTLLDPQGCFLLCQGKLHRLSTEQAQALIPFMRTQRATMDGQYHFSKGDALRLVSTILPLIERIGRVDIDPELSRQILRYPLCCQIYLDALEDGGIRANVLFRYGEREIQAFSMEQAIPDVLLVRDSLRERAVMDLLERYHFTVRRDGAHLSTPKDIYTFLRNGLSQLDAVAEVYLSEGLTRMRIRRTQPKLGMTLSRASGLLEIRMLMEDVEGEDTMKLLDALRVRQKYMRLQDGSFLEFEENPQLALLAQQLFENGTVQKDGTVELPAYFAPALADAPPEALEVTGKQLDQLAENLTHPTMNPAKAIGKLLRGYQLTGFRWLAALAQAGMGGILADDMGLGKTLQVIALIDWARQEEGPCPSLIVCPTTLIFNWRQEIEKFAPHLSLRVVEGLPENRAALLENLDGIDMVLTSYPLIRRDTQLYEEKIFRYCILDEAQHIKNAQTIGARAVKLLKAQARFALTGTPMENHLLELWSMFDFVLPGYLGRQEKFMETYGNGEDTQRLSRNIRPFVLRRLKKDVLSELPEKIETTFKAEMTKQQRSIYVETLNRLSREVFEEIDGNGLQRSRFKVLAAITRLRQICCEPSLYLEGYEGGSGKLELLMELLTGSVSGGHRLLVFSQFTSMLRIIRKRLEALEISCLFLDGQTPVDQREQLVTAFNQGFAPVFLISLKAGGTGLNLTGADTVVHFDPWWNPAVEEQATDRAYRIGQTKAVQVIRLITQGSIEERIEELKEKKRSLIDTVLTNQGKASGNKLSLEELKVLFGWKTSPA